MDEYPPLKNLCICVTGKLVGTGTRQDVQRFIEDRGGRFHPKVQSTTTHLIVGDTGKHGATQKVQAARQLGVIILTPGQFMDMVRERTDFASQAATDKAYESGTLAQVLAEPDTEAATKSIQEADDAWAAMKI